MSGPLGRATAPSPCEPPDQRVRAWPIPGRCGARSQVTRHAPPRHARASRRHDRDRLQHRPMDRCRSVQRPPARTGARGAVERHDPRPFRLAASRSRGRFAHALHPDPASLRQHSVPAWFDEAKFGIFLHWSLSTIPAYAPTEKGDFHEVIRKEGFETYFRYNPYSEWYLNGLRLGKGPVWEHHKATWGERLPLRAVQGRVGQLRFRAGIPTPGRRPSAPPALATWCWSPSTTTGSACGRVRCPIPACPATTHRATWWGSSRRPCVPAACDGALLLGGTGLDVRHGAHSIGSRPPDQRGHLSAYGAYAEARYRELIERYRPSILWNDIAYPDQGRYYKLLADYYEAVPERTGERPLDAVPGRTCGVPWATRRIAGSHPG